MNTKFLWLASSCLVCALGFCQAQAKTVSNATYANGAGVPVNENQLAGVVSQLTEDSIEINAKTYEFKRTQVKIYDLNGRVSQNAEIKTGMFVSFAFVKANNAARITELRLVRN